MTPKREMAVALILLAVSGAAGIAASLSTWAKSSCTDWLSATSPLARGADLMPTGLAISLAALAATLGVLATRRGGRRILGALISVGGVVGLLQAASALFNLNARATEWLTSDHASSECGQEITTFLLGPIVQLLASAVIAGIGVWIMMRGHQWRSMSSRYERAPKNTPANNRDAWDALDHGDDPTA